MTLNGVFLLFPRLSLSRTKWIKKLKTPVEIKCWPSNVSLKYLLYLSTGSFSCRLCREWMLKTNWRQKNVEQRQQYMQQEKKFDFVNTGGCLTELSSVWNFRIFSPLSFISIPHSIQTWSKGSKVGYIRFAVLVFKCMTSCAPEYLTSKLVGRSAVSTRNTRNSQLLNIPLFRTASGQRTFQYRATSLWNELQPALKLSPSVTEFKCLLRQKLLNDCFI